MRSPVPPHFSGQDTTDQFSLIIHVKGHSEIPIKNLHTIKSNFPCINLNDLGFNSFTSEQFLPWHNSNCVPTLASCLRPGLLLFLLNVHSSGQPRTEHIVSPDHKIICRTAALHWCCSTLRRQAQHQANQLYSVSPFFRQRSTHCFHFYLIPISTLSTHGRSKLHS